MSIAPALPAPTRRRLPILKANPIGEHPDFLRLEARELEAAGAVWAMPYEELRRRPLLSANAKTSVSFDLPVVATCRPTPVCGAVCYAAAPRSAATRRKSVKKRMRNLRVVLETPAEEVAGRLAREFERAQWRWRNHARLECLRLLGGGDLVEELVPVINLLARDNPDIQVWVVTRRFDLARGIEEWPNLYLQLSTDASTPPAELAKAHALVRERCRAYLSFLRTAPEEDPGAAAIVFNEKRTAGLPYDRVTDCPADAGVLPLENRRGTGGTACARCRKCFVDRTLERQALALAALDGAAEEGRQPCSAS